MLGEAQFCLKFDYHILAHKHCLTEQRAEFAMNLFNDSICYTEEMTRLYSKPPGLNNVELCAMSLYSDVISLTIASRVFPDRPYNGWVKAGYNRVHLDLYCENVQGVTVSGNVLGKNLDIEVKRTAPDSVQLDAYTRERQLLLTVTAQIIRLNSIQASLDEKLHRQRKAVVRTMHLVCLKRSAGDREREHHD